MKELFFKIVITGFFIRSLIAFSQEEQRYKLPSQLNEISGLENPTAENIAKWFWKQIKKKINNLTSIEIYRPRIGGCIYEGD